MTLCTSTFVLRMSKRAAMDTEPVEKQHVKNNNEANGDDSESMEVTPHTDNLNVPRSNLDISRSSSTSSLASSSQNDELGKNGNCPEETVSNDSEAVSEEVQKVPIRNIPAINVPEKIILCIDLSEEPNYTPFKLGDGTKYAPLYMIKRVTEIFIHSKSCINKSHEFALVVLQSDTAAWLRDFTNDPSEIISVLEDMSETQQGDTFDLSSLFDVISDHVSLPQVSEPNATPPPFAVRVVLLYSRSHCVPKFVHGQESLSLLLSSDYFTLDILYIHEDPSEANKCEEIFSALDDLDDRGFSYVFDVSRNTTKLHDNMAKLLGHPLQRPVQKMAHYKLEFQDK